MFLKKEILFKIKKKLYRYKKNELEYLWFIENKDTSKILNTSYSNNKTIIFLSTEKDNLGGLCDKLRGAISTFSIAKELNIDFRIVFNYPFCLEEYLEPNHYDWRLKEKEINKDINPVILKSYVGCYEDNNNEEKNFQHQKLLEIVEKAPDKSDIYIKTNAYSGNKDFHNLFHFLFRPSLRLNNLINQYFKPNVKYISISFRFMNLLGDFQDCTIVEALDEKEKQKYIADSIGLIKTLYEKNKTNIEKVFVATDSITFLDEAKKLDFVFTIPGKISHTNLPAENFDKEFLDLYIISQAQCIYLGRKKKMWSSCFPLYASFIENKPFEKIEY